MRRWRLVLALVSAGFLLLGGSAGCTANPNGTRWREPPGHGAGASPQPSTPPNIFDPIPSGPFGSMTSTGSTDVALTFDDGPDPHWTPKVLALLNQHRVRATFCLIGSLAQRYPELVRAIARDGHALCNHSWSHNFALGRLSPAEITSDLTRTNDAIRKAVPGAPIEYYRQPGGMWTERVVRVAKRSGMRSLHWSMDPQDWRKPAPETIVQKVTGGTRPGTIVLMHDGGGDRESTYLALYALLPDLSSKYRLIPL